MALIQCPDCAEVFCDTDTCPNCGWQQQAVEQQPEKTPNIFVEILNDLENNLGLTPKHFRRGARYFLAAVLMGAALSFALTFEDGEGWGTFAAYWFLTTIGFLLLVPLLFKGGDGGGGDFGGDGG